MKTTAWGLCLALAAAPACATTARLPHAPTGLRIGTVSEASNFEKREAASSKDPFDEPDTDKAAKRRKGAFWAGVVMAGLGGAGSLAFGLGGRIVQGQLSDGYDNQDLTRAEEERLQDTGKTMNGLTIGSASVGLVGIVMLSVAYALDHARCGELPPKRKECGSKPAALQP